MQARPPYLRAIPTLGHASFWPRLLLATPPTTSVCSRCENDVGAHLVGCDDAVGDVVRQQSHEEGGVAGVREGASHARRRTRAAAVCIRPRSRAAATRSGGRLGNSISIVLHTCIRTVVCHRVRFWSVMRGWGSLRHGTELFRGVLVSRVYVSDTPSSILPLILSQSVWQCAYAFD